MAALNTVVSIVYYVRVLATAYFDANPPSIPVLGRWSAIATLAMAAALIAVGIAAEPFVRAFAASGLLP